uniref:Replication factor A C-terminal domain-containing protein n=1 Tax=Noccaea caerulescens TaxID=107243 RepID=A0A1J3F1U7_NOCCA
MRTKKYNGKASVQNSRFSTKLFFNEEIEEIALFKSKVPKSDNAVSLIVSPMRQHSSAKTTVDSFPLHSWKTIETFTAATEESTCVTFAEIITFEKQFPWYYVGCNGCLGKATPFFNPEKEEVEEGKYSCDSCNKQETNTSLRYCVHVKVADHTSTTSFLLFDREVIQLLHKSAYELLEQQLEFNPQGEIPSELIGLEGKNIVWVIRVHGTKKHFRHSSFKVVKLSNEEEVVRKFKDNLHVVDASNSEMPIVSSTSSALQTGNTSSEAINSELPLSSPVTPATKRHREELIQEEVAEESSTKNRPIAKSVKPTRKIQNVKKENQYERKKQTH